MTWLFTSKYWTFSCNNSLSMNTQCWFPLWLTGLIFCSSRDSQESSPALQLKSIISLVLSLLSGPTLISVYDSWKNHSFDYMDLCQPNDVSATKPHFNKGWYKHPSRTDVRLLQGAATRWPVTYLAPHCCSEELPRGSDPEGTTPADSSRRLLHIWDYPLLFKWKRIIF